MNPWHRAVRRRHSARPAASLPGALQLSWILNARGEFANSTFPDCIVGTAPGWDNRRTGTADRGAARRDRIPPPLSTEPVPARPNRWPRRWLAESSRENNRWAIRNPPTARPSRALGRPRPPAATARRAPPGPARPGSCGLLAGRCRRGPIPRRPRPESRRSTCPIPPPRPDEAAHRPRRGRLPRAGFSSTRKPWGH